MADKIISTIRNKFIENLDEGLLLRQDTNNLQLSEEEIDFFKRLYRASAERKEVPLPEKPTPLITLFPVERSLLNNSKSS